MTRRSQDPKKKPASDQAGRMVDRQDPRQADQQPPPGLDAAKHAATQRTAFQAESLRKRAFPALMATALQLDSLADSPAYQLYLDQFTKDAGATNDPVQQMLLHQLCLAHFRIAQLHGDAQHANNAEEAKIYTAAASRLLGELRRTALALQSFGHAGTTDRRKMKLLKMAQ